MFEDGLGLFEGLDSFVGDFTVFEQSQGLPSAARAIAAAGRDPSQPAFVAYRPRRRAGDPHGHAAVVAASWRRRR